MKVCSVTILYNPTDDFFINLNSYCSLVDFVILVDNSSTNDTLNMHEKIRHILGNDNFLYLSENYNLGIAKALNRAFQWAQLNFFTHVLTMDQDSRFNSPDFFRIAMPFLNDPEFAVVAASYEGKLPFRNRYNTDFDSVLFTITSGNIVSLNAWEKVKGFEERFFIDEVDNDFCLRVVHQGFKIITSRNVFLIHNLGQTISINTWFSKKKFNIGIHRPERIYFMVRNGFCVIFKNFTKSPKFSLNRINNLIIKLCIIVLFYPKKLQYLRFYFLGMKNYIFNRFDNSYLQ